MTAEAGYLLSHSIGLTPLAARTQGIADYVEVLDSDPANAWPHWFGIIDGFREAIAQLLSTEASLVCPQVNVSSGLTKVMQSLPLRGGRSTQLTTTDAFPSLGFVLGHTREHVEFLPSDLDATDPQVWADRFDDDIDVVLITHVHSNTGELIPVGAIVEAARAHGIVTVVDVAQSAGVIPIDCAEWNADFVVGSCVKWLCGGPGAGFLWVHPDMVDRCRPTDVGWFSHEDPFEFDIHHFAYASDALRFWGGTPSVLPSSIARRSIEALVEIGVARVREQNHALVDRLIDGVPSSMIVSPTNRERRAGTVVLQPGGDLNALVDRLVAGGVAVDARPNGLRVSPHVWNTERDVDALIDLLSISNV